MGKRNHKNFDIIQVIALPEQEYVLGVKSINDKNEYVTWCCVEKDNYHYGHYFSDYRTAVKDLYERAKNYAIWTLENILWKELKKLNLYLLQFTPLTI